MPDCDFHKTFGLLYLIRLFAEAFAVNIAFNRSGKYCNVHEMSKIVFDGDTNFSNSEFWNGMCPDIAHSFLKVDLMDEYSIQHVIVYHGPRNTARQLNFFKVQFRNIEEYGERMTLCSEYPFVMPMPGQAMRMNCEPTHKLFTEVHLNSHYNKGFDIAEIELHTLATELPDIRNVLIYRGCFLNFGSSSVVLDFMECHRKCLRQGYSFFGTKANLYCGCDDNLNPDEEIPLEACSQKCDGRYCGSESGYSVYVVKPPLPWYNGCYRITSHLTIDPTISGNMTVLKCLHRCSDFHYAKLQAGDFCLCRNSILSTETKVVSSDCNSPCSGNNLITCGGSRTVAIYSTCKQGLISVLSCPDFLMCNSTYDVFGMCTTCQPGYTGKYCIEISGENPDERENSTIHSDDSDFFENLFYFRQKLKEYIPFMMPFLAVITLGSVLLCLNPKKGTESTDTSRKMTAESLSEDLGRRYTRRETIVRKFTKKGSMALQFAKKGSIALQLAKKGSAAVYRKDSKAKKDSKKEKVDKKDSKKEKVDKKDSKKEKVDKKDSKKEKVDKKDSKKDNKK